MNVLNEVRRVIELAIMPIKTLPLESDYRKGQLDMADMILRLVDIMNTERRIDA